MKYLLFFILLLPTVLGVAVTPTSLDFGEVERGEEVVRELLVINNEDFTKEYKVGDEEFFLFPGEDRLIPVSLEVVDKEDGKYEEYLKVEEKYSSELVNIVSIRIVYRVNGGKFTDEKLDFSSIKVRKSFPYMALLSGIGLLGVGIYGWKRRRQKVYINS
ncbi:MAG: hypothetical protein Q8Q35_00425 [Nanoarchaeota archaeon]|nr:hypothetical protein [Nanoarchaeota archaeon]